MNPGPESSVSASAVAPAPAAAAAEARRGPSWLVLAGVALLVMMLVRGLVVQSFFVPSGSMEPTIEPGDRILVNKTVDTEDLRRGDVVVFDGSHSFAGPSPAPYQSEGLIGRTLAGAASLFGVNLGEKDFVKRIVGLPGDRVACCDEQGRMTVNGTAVTEDYLPPKVRPSDVTFDVTVPADRLWVMGDNRSNSADSRAHLGDPGGGMVRLSDVVGRVWATYWPLSRVGGFDTPPALSSIARAKAGS